MFCTNKKTLSSLCQFKETKTLNLTFRGTTLLHPFGCPLDAITSLLYHGSSRLPLLQMFTAAAPR